MFHQANVVSTSWAAAGDNMAVNPVPTDSPSLLEYWYERVLAHMAMFINTSTFPIKVSSKMFRSPSCPVCLVSLLALGIETDNTESNICNIDIDINIDAIVDTLC